MLKPVFSRFTPIKNFDSIVKLRKQTIQFFRFDTPTGFTKDEFVTVFAIFLEFLEIFGDSFILL